MLKFLIVSTLIVTALALPALRTARDVEQSENSIADPTEVKEDGTTLDERFGGHGYGHQGHRGYGHQGYGQPGYGYGQQRPNYGGQHYPQGGHYRHQGYYPQQHGPIYPGGGYQPIVPLGK